MISMYLRQLPEGMRFAPKMNGILVMKIIVCGRYVELGQTLMDYAARSPDGVA